MSDIFISYKSEDKDKAALFANAFAAQGWSVFWDKDIPPGQPFDRYIGDKLDEARCVVVLWSEQSITSDWVKEEADYGKRRAMLMPVFIDQVAPPLGFGRIEAAELFDWDGDPSDAEFQNLVKAIEALLGRQEAAEPEPEPETAPAPAVETPPSAPIAETPLREPVEKAKPSGAPAPASSSSPFPKKYVFGGLGVVAVVVILFILSQSIGGGGNGRPVPPAQERASPAETAPNFSNPRAAAETCIRALRPRNLGVLGRCFADGDVNEQKLATLKDWEGATVIDVEGGGTRSRATVIIGLRDSEEDVPMINTGNGWQFDL